jgi:hypothetical protein
VAKYELTDTEMCALAFLHGTEIELQQKLAAFAQQRSKIYNEIEKRLGVEKLFDESAGAIRLDGRVLIKEEKVSNNKVRELKRRNR